MNFMQSLGRFAWAAPKRPSVVVPANAGTHNLVALDDVDAFIAERRHEGLNIFRAVVSEGSSSLNWSNVTKPCMRPSLMAFRMISFRIRSSEIGIY
jgi:hypothetical protein